MRVIGALLGLVGVGTSAFMVSIANHSTEVPPYAFALVPALVAATLATLFLSERRRISLRLTDDGVEYQAFGTVVRAAWDDLVGLCTVEHGPFAGIGVRLRSGTPVSASLSARAWILAGVVPPGHAIPLSPFIGRERGTWLESELRRRVPDLEESRSPSRVG
jgi:hypothetical protein